MNGDERGGYDKVEARENVSIERGGDRFSRRRSSFEDDDGHNKNRNDKDPKMQRREEYYSEEDGKGKYSHRDSMNNGKESSRTKRESFPQDSERMDFGRHRSDSDDVSEDKVARKITRRLMVDKEDAAFILGRHGSTKRKISRVAQADIELDDDGTTITVRGTEKQVERAEDYLDFVRQQRAGPVTVALDHKRDDFTAYQVPEDCIGFIMGRAGQTLRNMEDEWGVLMFFARTTLHGKQIGPTTQGAEYLCIFGELPARRGAEIKVMSAVEHKHPGYCIDSRNQLRAINRVPGDEDLDGWGVETVLLTEENFRYALGTRGSARRKLATASGCIVEYVGKLACFVGYASDRRRGQDYLRWLLQQRTGVSNIENPRDRKDCTVVKIPMESVGFINGHHGESLKEIERESRTFCFSLSDRNAQNRVDNKMSYEPYYIFSFDRRAREYAADLLEERVREHRRIGGPRPPRRQFVEDHQSFGRQSRGYGGRSRGDFDTERDYGGAGRRRRRDSDFSDDDIDRRRRRRYD